MVFYSLVNTFVNSCFTKWNRLRCAKIILINDRMLVSCQLIYIHVSSKTCFLVLGLNLVNLVHYKEIFRILSIKVDRIQGWEIWFILRNAVPKMINRLKHIFRRVHKHFNFFSELYLKRNQCNLELLVVYHGNVFKFKPLEKLLWDGNSINFIFHALHVIK